MKYRHAFHAGNAGDVLKHVLLLALVKALRLKEGALTLLDTHAGRGLYDLAGPDAIRTNEANSGVARVLANQPPVLDDYRAAITAVQTDYGPSAYPGSPLLLAGLLRAQDRLIVNEKHPEEAALLRQALRGAPAQIHERDAYELWPALLPFETSRGLVLVDPPYEIPGEWDRIANALQYAQRVWAHGVTAIWYPVKDRAAQAAFEEKLAWLNIAKLYRVEHWLSANAPAGTFNGSGLYLINPPYAFVQKASALVEAVRAALANPDNPGRAKADWL